MACWVASAVTGSPDEVLPTVQAVLTAPRRSGARRDEAVAAATDFLAQVADQLAVVPAELTEALNTLLAAGVCTTQVARARWRLGGQPDQLVPPLLKAYPSGWKPDGAGELLVEMGAVDALAGLDRLADQDARSRALGKAFMIVWDDERRREHLRTTADQLRRLT